MLYIVSGTVNVLANKIQNTALALMTWAQEGLLSKVIIWKPYKNILGELNSKVLSSKLH